MLKTSAFMVWAGSEAMVVMVVTRSVKAVPGPDGIWIVELNAIDQRRRNVDPFREYCAFTSEISMRSGRCCCCCLLIKMMIVRTASTRRSDNDKCWYPAGPLTVKVRRPLPQRTKATKVGSPAEHFRVDVTVARLPCPVEIQGTSCFLGCDRDGCGRGRNILPDHNTGDWTEEDGVARAAVGTLGM